MDNKKKIFFARTFSFLFPPYKIYCILTRFYKTNGRNTRVFHVIIPKQILIIFRGFVQSNNKKMNLIPIVSNITLAL